MTLPRLYQPTTLLPGSVLKLDEKASHHLASVLRAKVGEEVMLFNGDSLHRGDYQARITRIDKKNVEVSILAFIPKNVESNLNIHLAQGIARGEKMDFILQKAVELGVKRVTPLFTERTNVKLDKEREAKRLKHWEGVIISACEQCGRNVLPILDAPLSLKEWLKQVKADVCFVLSPHDSLPQGLKLNTTPQSIALLIGPEGGFSRVEIESAQQHQFIPLQLGPRTLRTETAGIVALTAMACWYGDFHLRPVP